MTAGRVRWLGLVVGLMTAATMLALPGGAAATTYCVNDPSCVGTSEANVQQALDVAGANTGFDTVKVGPGTYVRANGFCYCGGSGSVALIGAGKGNTILAIPGDDNASETVLGIVSGASSSVKDLTVNLPTEPAFNLNGDTGLALSGTTADGVRVAGPGSTNNNTGVLMSGTASFTDGAVSMPVNVPFANTGIFNRNVGTVVDSTVQAPIGMYTGDSLTVNRTRIVPGANGGVGIDDDSGAMSVRNSLIDLGDQPGGVGLRAVNTRAGAEFAMSIHADHVTIVRGTTNSVGLQVLATASLDNGHQSATATLNNSVIRGPAVSIDREAQNTSSTNPGTNTANVTTRYSNYSKARQTSVNGANGTGSISAIHFVSGAPAFVGPTDFRPANGSNLVDSGDPTFSGGTDLNGNPRVFDGDGDGTAITDLGAYERQ